jgi:DNA-binding transcriptional regulator YiaG
MKNEKHACVECGAEMHARAYVQRIRVGRYKVDDGSKMLPTCANGHVELSLDDLAEYERRASAVVLAEAADIGPAEIRFARKSLGLTQARLAALMQVAPETVSRWESSNDPPTISRVSRLALLAIVQGSHSLARLDDQPARTAEVLKVHAA